MGKIYMIGSQKGGTAKTTTTFNLAYCLRERYDYILIDTCPSLGTLTINALAASDEVIITVNPQLLAMMGMQGFLRTVVKIRKRINPGLGIAGILMNMCESRTKLCKVLTEEVTESFQEQIRVFETRIPSTVKVGECIIFHKHRASQPYHQHGRARSLRQAVRSIMGHDVFQMNGRKRS